METVDSLGNVHRLVRATLARAYIVDILIHLRTAADQKNHSDASNRKIICKSRKTPVNSGCFNGFKHITASNGEHCNRAFNPCVMSIYRPKTKTKLKKNYRPCLIQNGFCIANRRGLASTTTSNEIIRWRDANMFTSADWFFVYASRLCVFARIIMIIAKPTRISPYRSR